MAEYEIGSLVRSLAGHDKGGYYIIIKEDGPFVHLADGRLRPLAKAKRKKKKHVQLTAQVMKELAEKPAGGGRVTDEAIKSFIKQYHQTDQKNPGR